MALKRAAADWAWSAAEWEAWSSGSWDTVGARGSWESAPWAPAAKAGPELHEANDSGERFLRSGADETTDLEEERFLAAMASVKPKFQIWEKVWSKKYNKFKAQRNANAPPQPGQPWPGLLLGDLDDCWDKGKLEAANVGVVVCLCPEALEGAEVDFDGLLAEANIKLLKIEAHDSHHYDILQHLVEVASVVKGANDAQKDALVVCWGGVNRSATLVVAYMNQCLNVPLLEAFEKTVAARGEVILNGHFRSALARAAVAQGEKAPEARADVEDEEVAVAQGAPQEEEQPEAGTAVEEEEQPENV